MQLDKQYFMHLFLKSKVKYYFYLKPKSKINEVNNTLRVQCGQDYLRINFSNTRNTIMPFTNKDIGGDLIWRYLLVRNISVFNPF